MSKILIISGHPNLDSVSTANKRILDRLESSNLDLSIRRLNELHDGFKFDIEAEQAALLEADIVVLQTPMYWYSVPALLKHWIDEVFAYGFAYGSTGDKLKDKGFLMSMTISSPKGCYQTLGYNNFTVDEFLNHLKQTALLCQMVYQDPELSYEVLYIPGIAGTQEAVESIADDHAQRLIRRLEAYNENGIDYPIKSKKF